MRRTLTVLLPMLLVLSRLLPAQSVSGSLRADVDNRAIAGAVVLLLGVPSDSVLGRTTTFIDGRFVVRAPDSLSLAGQLLTEARTAWQSSLSTTSGVELAADYMMYSRDEDRRGRTLTPEAVSFRSRLTDRPFASLPPSVIATKGYVTTDSDSVWYRGPDEAILLSPGRGASECGRYSRNHLDAIRRGDVE